MAIDWATDCVDDENGGEGEDAVVARSGLRQGPHEGKTWKLGISSQLKWPWGDVLYTCDVLICRSKPKKKMGEEER